MKMKIKNGNLRVIERDGLFIPQQYKESNYSRQWVGFCAGYGSPSIKFVKQNLAEDFIILIMQKHSNSKKRTSVKIVYELCI